jgi:GNAT superfamily N-acetyltransferase
VALSELWSSQADLKKLFTGLTGVLRSHRRRGLATAVKVRAICFAQRYGATILETDNEENNPMFQLNLQLGFQPQPALIEFKKKM